MIALACIALGLAATATAGLIVFALQASRAKDGQLAARDLLDKTREELRTVRGELDAETAAHAVTRDLLKKEQDLRASVESQRNDAWRQAREDTVKIIEASGIADAVSLGNRILQAPLPGAKRSESGPDALIDPEL